ncbi:MAG: nucleotidyltransferase family protein [Candidatus Aminicenantes bacterium]|nr:nucleotidyltransferase family protein [Candidatus Aminicenantes bacterium]
MRTLKEIKEILASHKNQLMEKYKIKEIKIFGSYVRNEQKKRSDVDILVDFYEVPDLLRFIEIERYLEEVLGIKVDLVPKPALRTELREIILREAVEI